MIHFQEFFLDNGLHVIVHEDKTVPIAVLNLMYDVGSRDEDENKTGFAHLFEHLMFGGSLHIPYYDREVQRVGGENNAFTSPDVTNYYIILPASNIETAFWLESDRMLGLNFLPEVLEREKSVVIEEFKQRYLNQPYGDAWLKLRPLAYRKHPYQWATIGKEIAHIERATMHDVQDFFFHHYAPNNAVLCVAGNVTLEQIKRLSEKWFGDIPPREVPARKLPQEPPQKEMRFLELNTKVPVDMIYMAFHMVGKNHPDFFATDLLSNVLGGRESSRLYRKLVKERELFTYIDTYVLGSFDPGLLVINGRITSRTSFQTAFQAIQEIIEELLHETISEEELEKVKNQAESSLIYDEMELLNRAMNLCYGALMGNVNFINEEIDRFKQVTSTDIQRVAQQVLPLHNCSVLYYKAE
ncbi:MAG: insulinase family protein [Cytophagales bacterium]|nr:insulinase family protein [Cytophagales bacterium]MDW8384790.1 pitrilysin family protein [Flammeovirgaceae bacterium]